MFAKSPRNAGSSAWKQALAQQFSLFLSTPACNFLLSSEGLAKCFVFPPYPLLSQFACICSLLLLLHLSKWYLSVLGFLLCIFGEDPTLQSSLALWSADDSQNWMWGFHELLS